MLAFRKAVKKEIAAMKPGTTIEMADEGYGETYDVTPVPRKALQDGPGRPTSGR